MVTAYPDHISNDNNNNNNNNKTTPPCDPYGDEHGTEKMVMLRCASSAHIPRVGSRSAFKQPGSPRSSIPKVVSFHQIEIREFAIELGDNPSATGAPITIGWEPQSNDIVAFDDYEAAKQGSVREKSQFHMPAKFRCELLTNQGTTMRQIMDVERETRKIKKAREDSIKSRRWDGVNEKLEAARRTVKKVAKPFNMSRKSTLPAAVRCAQGEDDDIDEGPLMF